MTMPDWRWCVYALVDTDGNTFYIGKGSNTSDRWSYWRCVAKRSSTKPAAIAIRRLWQEGKDFSYSLLLTTDDEQEAWDAEARFILDNAQNRHLVNVYDGGRSPSMPKSIREKLACASRGRQHTTSSREKMRAAWTDERIKAYSGRDSYTFCSLSGERVQVVNLTRFCEENKLSCSHMREVSRGKRKSCRGWTAAV